MRPEARINIGKIERPDLPIMLKIIPLTEKKLYQSIDDEVDHEISPCLQNIYKSPEYRQIRKYQQARAPHPDTPPDSL